MIAFYEQAFGATVTSQMTTPGSNQVMHAELKIGDSVVMLSEENIQMCGHSSPLALGGSPVSLHLYVEDADAAAAQAVEAGATLVVPVTEMFWGDRFGKLADPFGHLWSVATHVEDVTPEQMKERMVSAFAQAGVA